MKPWTKWEYKQRNKNCKKEPNKNSRAEKHKHYIEKFTTGFNSKLKQANKSISKLESNHLKLMRERSNRSVHLWKNWTPVHCRWERKMVLWKTLWQFFKPIKIALPCDHFWVTSKRTESRVSKKYLQDYIHSSIIYNIQGCKQHKHPQIQCNISHP